MQILALYAAAVTVIAIKKHMDLKIILLYILDKGIKPKREDIQKYSLRVWAKFLRILK